MHTAPHIKSEGPTLVDWLLKEFPEVKNVGDPLTRAGQVFRPGIVHRLDKTTSGVMVIARTQEAFNELKKLFQEHKIVKKYTALVRGAVLQKSGAITLPLLKSKSSVKYPKRRIAKKDEEGKTAETHWRVIKNFGDYALLEVEPKTGRTHQIRVHLAATGHPIVGDKIYGKDKKSILSRPFLHASSLKFSLFGAAYQFENPLPSDLQEFLDGLELNT